MIPNWLKEKLDGVIENYKSNYDDESNNNDRKNDDKIKQ